VIISKKNASRFLLTVIVLFLVVGITAAVYIFRSNPVDDALSDNRVINVLFVIEDEKMPLSTYVLMYYPATGRAAVFDIPSELRLLLKKFNRYDRIDKVYDPARIAGYEDEIEKLLDIELNFSVVITKENLISLVDLLEGVEIFIPSTVSYRDGKQLVLFPSGMTVLDGDKAGLYAAYSLPDEDRDTEMSRRQRFFLGLMNRWIGMNDTLKNPATAKIYYSLLQTGMNQRTLMRLFDEFVHIDTDRTNIQSVTGNLQEVSGQILLFPHWGGDLVKEVVRQTLKTLTSEVETFLSERTHTVEVLNGTAINGLAGKTADMLRSFGYDIISVGNADRNDYEYTVIIHRSGDDNMVKSFADVIRCQNIRREMEEPDENELIIHNYEYKADFTLIIGRDFNGRYVTGN
jgi:anionic cell wall polymer biosynthesis LytR-Cps2A-Psr (LCP) family protein